MKTGDVVEVEWEDHALIIGPECGLGLARQRSLGYFVRQDEKVFVLSHSVTTDDGSTKDVYADTLVIGKSMLLKVRRLRAG